MGSASRNILVVLLLGVVLVACGVPATRSTFSGEPIKIGAIVDLTGPTSDVGVPYANGVEAYVDYVNRNGGVNGRQLQLLVQDSAYRVENAERSYTQFVNQENVVAIVGWGTAETEALKNRITADQLPFMSGSLAEELTNVTTAPYNFVVGVTYSDQILIGLRYLLEQEQSADVRIAYLYNDSPFGRSPIAALDDVAAEYDVALLKVAMPRGAVDLRPQMEQISHFDPDYVVIQNTPGPAVLALRAAAAIDLHTQFVLLNFAANETLIQQAGELAEGAIGVLPFAPPTDNHAAATTINTYLRATNRGTLADRDKGLSYSQGWTIMSVMVEGIRRAAASGEVSGPAIKAGLEQLQNFETGGVTSPISFGPDDHKGATALRLYRVQHGAWVPISEMLDAAP
jgi:branched-chain amino acid transport system substrate-binding protein